MVAMRMVPKIQMRLGRLFRPMALAATVLAASACSTKAESVPKGQLAIKRHDIIAGLAYMLNEPNKPASPDKPIECYANQVAGSGGHAKFFQGVAASMVIPKAIEDCELEAKVADCLGTALFDKFKTYDMGTLPEPAAAWLVPESLHRDFLSDCNGSKIPTIFDAPSHLSSDVIDLIIAGLKTNNECPILDDQPAAPKPEPTATATATATAKLPKPKPTVTKPRPTVIKPRPTVTRPRPTVTKPKPKEPDIPINF